MMYLKVHTMSNIKSIGANTVLADSLAPINTQKSICNIVAHDSKHKVLVRDTLNWAILPADANMDNPKSKWNKIIAHREYLSDALKVLETTEEALQISKQYNELLKVFKQLEEWKQGSDIYTISQPSREFIVSKNGSFYMGHQYKDRVQNKLFEFFIKTNVMSGMNIIDSLYAVCNREK